jgi:hypothetical protein
MGHVQSSVLPVAFCIWDSLRGGLLIHGSPIPSTTEIQSAIEEEHVSISSENAGRL